MLNLLLFYCEKMQLHYIWLFELMQKWPNICNNCRTHVTAFHCFKNTGIYSMWNINAWDWNFVAQENTLYSTRDQRKSHSEWRKNDQIIRLIIIYVIQIMKSFCFDAFQILNSPARCTNHQRLKERQECTFSSKIHSFRRSLWNIYDCMLFCCFDFQPIRIQRVFHNCLPFFHLLYLYLCVLCTFHSEVEIY